MEVLFTLTLIALVVTPLMFQQGTILRNVHRLSQRVHRTFAAQQFLYEVRKDIPEYATTFTREKKLIDIDTVLTFSREPIAKKSALAKQQHLFLDRVTIAWREDGQAQRDMLVTFVHVRPQQEVA